MNKMPPPLLIPGFSKPSIDMQAVRDGRRAPIFQTLIDLSGARSIAAGTHLVIPLAGNSLYSDPLVDLAGLQIAGTCRVHLQNTELSPLQGAAGTIVGGAVNTVQPGYTSRVPFTQLLIENYAQAGKFALLCYGMDIDFNPGAGQQVSILGTVSIVGPHAVNVGPGLGDLPLLVRDVGEFYGASFASGAALGAGATQTIVAAASNVNGMLVHRALNASKAATDQQCAVLAKSSAPTSVIDGDPILVAIALANTVGYDRLQKGLFIPAGKGLFTFAGAAETLAYRAVEYTLL